MLQCGVDTVVFWDYHELGCCCTNTRHRLSGHMLLLHVNACYGSLAVHGCDCMLCCLHMQGNLASVDDVHQCGVGSSACVLRCSAACDAGPVCLACMLTPHDDRECGFSICHQVSCIVCSALGSVLRTRWAHQAHCWWQKLLLTAVQFASSVSRICVLPLCIPHTGCTVGSPGLQPDQVVESRSAFAVACLEFSGAGLERAGCGRAQPQLQLPSIYISWSVWMAA